MNKMKKVMGVGTAYLMAAQFVTIVSNYLIHIGLARYLGLKIYGIFGVLMSLYHINRVFLTNAIPKAVSKFISESKTNINSIFRSSFKLQFLFASLFALFYILFSSQISSILNDSSLKIYIIILGIMVIPLSLLFLYLEGFMNGLRMFKKQAIAKMIYSIMRLIFSFILVFLGFKIFGVLFAYLLAVLLSIIIAQKMLKFKLKPVKKEFSSKKIIKFALPITIAALAVTYLKNINVLFIRAFLNDYTLAGLYTAAATLSNFPFLIFVGLASTLMPSISKAVSLKNTELSKKYITQSLRYLFLFLLPLSAIVSVTSKELITLFYSSTYASAGPVLSILIFSSIFLIAFGTLVAVIIGSGKPKIYMTIALVLMIILTILNIFLIPILGIIGAAIALLLTSLLAFIIAAVYVYSKFKALITIKSVIRILIASILILIIAHLWHYSGILLLLNYAVFMMIYFALLFAMKEINKQDIDLFKKSLRLKRSS